MTIQNRPDSTECFSHLQACAQDAETTNGRAAKRVLARPDALPCSERELNQAILLEYVSYNVRKVARRQQSSQAGL